MQQNKGKKDLSDIAKFCTKDNIFIEAFGSLLTEFDLRYINVLLSKSKSKGQNPANVFQILFVLQYFDLKNISQFFYQKITINRF